MLQAREFFYQRIEYKNLVAIAFVFGLFMDVLDSTIINVALPQLGRDFNAGTAALEWVVTGYLLSLAIWIPASGWIGDRFGTKRTFLFATAMFLAGSMLCGAAWSVTSLAVFRVIQGIGGGMMTPVGTAMLFRAFTPQERARASMYLAIPTQVAPMLGPLLGGFFVDAINWRWIFYINLPVGVLSFLFSLIVLKEHKEPNAGRFDPLGFVLSGVGLASILFALSSVVEQGWSSPVVLISGIGGLVCFGLLIVVEVRSPAPMLDLSLFRNGVFRSGNIVAFTIFVCQQGVFFLLPLFLQDLRGLSAFESGLVTVAQPISAMLLVQVTSRIYNRVGGKRMMMASTVAIMLTSVFFLLVGLETDIWWIRGILFFRGAVIALNSVALQATVFATIPRPSMGRASSLYSTLQRVAAATGVAILGTVLASRTAALVPAGATGAVANQGSLLAFHDAFGVAAVIAAVGLLMAFRIKDPGYGAPARPASETPAAIPASPSIPAARA